MRSNLIVVRRIQEELSKLDFVKGLIQYGSSVTDRETRDVDIACFLDSENGVVSPEHYTALRNIRKQFSSSGEFDIDLVPHTSDEISDFISPLYNPRYNPSLSSGKVLMGDISVPMLSEDKEFRFSDMSRYVLLDNRTITRRQLVRSLKKEEFNIFLSKLAHTPGNILTYRAILREEPYYSNPSDLRKSAEILDAQDGSEQCVRFITSIQKLKEEIHDPKKDYVEDMIFQQACGIMNSFEKIVFGEFYSKSRTQCNSRQCIMSGNEGR